MFAKPLYNFETIESKFFRATKLAEDKGLKENYVCKNGINSIPYKLIKIDILFVKPRKFKNVSFVWNLLKSIFKNNNSKTKTTATIIIILIYKYIQDTSCLYYKTYQGK